MADFATADNIINDAAVELGLAVSDAVDPFASTDPNIILLRRLLRRVGRSLVRARDWTHLTQEHTFNTVASTASYALPSGFARMKDQTEWNRTTSNPLGPPLNSQQWQEAKARTAVGVSSVPFRTFGNLLHLYPTPTAVEAIYYEFISNFWVVPTGQTAPTTTTPTAITDTLWFDESLLVFGLKLAFLRAKSRDTSHAQEEFNQAWSAAAGGDGAAMAISLTGRGQRFPQMGRPPDTGWGL